MAPVNFAILDCLNGCHAYRLHNGVVLQVRAMTWWMQGREHEWLFATAEGQWAVAADCMSKRVILVVLNRGHTFKGTAAVNKELSPLVRCMSLPVLPWPHAMLSDQQSPFHVVRF